MPTQILRAGNSAELLRRDSRKTGSGADALVIGNEGKGIGRLVAETCDGLVAIPMNGKLNSLNASAAAAILLYEAVRQRLQR